MRNFFRHFAKDESGIGLVIIFQTQITKVVNNIFKTITSKTGKIK